MMKRLSQKERLWFDALRTENRTFEDRPDPFDRLFTHRKPKKRRQWIKGMISIVGSVVLIGYSFSPAWANPGEDSPPPNDVLIPVDEIMKGQIMTKQKEGPVHEEADHSSQDTNKEQDKEVETSTKQIEEENNPESQGTSDSTKTQSESKVHPEKKQTSQEMSRIPVDSSVEETNQNRVDVVKESPLSKKDTNQHSHKEQDNFNTHQTEEGGKLPDTATPWMNFLLRGFGLVLLGIGLRCISRVRTE